MKATRKLNRRSFLGTVAGGIAGAGALIAVASDAEAMQCSDSDSGPNSDPPGRGRSCGGYSDSDSGPNSDPPGRGRGNSNRRTGLTDRDSGSNADPAGNGRGRRRGRCSGATDSDRGAWADPARCGRGRHN